MTTNTAGLPEHKSRYDAAGIARDTARAYDDLLQELFVIEHVPAWSGSAVGRLNQTPKRYLTDPALAGPLLGIDVRGAMRNADVLGRIIDTFVAAQLRAELPVGETASTLFHVRDAKGRHEVDLVAEAADGRIAAFEIKASTTAGGDTARHLKWLRDRLRERFVIGVVFHTGPLPSAIDDRIIGLPICAIWA